jgi:hypothetical protein
MVSVPIDRAAQYLTDSRLPAWAVFAEILDHVRIESQRRGLLAVRLGRAAAPDNSLGGLCFGQWLPDLGIRADQLASRGVDQPAIGIPAHLAA